MKDTVKALIEAAATPEIDFLTKNTAALNMLDTIAEADRYQTQFTPQKVIVQTKFDKSGYLVEYANNLERLMLDQDVGIGEAMQMVCDQNNLSVEECTVVFDESCVNRIDISAVINADPDFDMVKI